MRWDEIEAQRRGREGLLWRGEGDGVRKRVKYGEGKRDRFWRFMIFGIIIVIGIR